MNKYSLLRSAFPILAAGLVWEFASDSGLVNPRLFPAPTTITIAAIEWIQSGLFWRDLGQSYLRLLLGLTLGGLGGVIIGLVTGRNLIWGRLLTPLIQSLRPLPPVAIIPLVIVWLGIGLTAKVFSTAFAVFFPVWINTHIGASNIPVQYLWSARVLSASQLDIVFRVLIPAALPAIVAGLRNGIAIAFIMVYVSEIAGASSGLGYRISVAHLAYRIDLMVAALAVLAGAGATADFLFSSMMRQLFPWLKGGTE